jgi:type I restriction enzyme S subunit
LLTSGHLKSGDILVTTRGDIGSLAKVTDDFDGSNINAQICLMRVDGKLSSDYLFQYLGTSLGKTQFRQLQSGSALKQLPKEKLGCVKISLPSKQEQQKIAGFLTVVDEKIEKLEEKKKAFEKYKKGVIQAIFSQKVRFKKPDGSNYSDWEEKKLGDLLNYEQPTKYIVGSTEYSNNFKTPVLTAGKTFILGYTDETNSVYDDLPVIIFDDFTTASQFVDFTFKVKSSAMKILKPKSGTNIRFVFETLQQIKYEVGGHGRHWISIFSNMKVCVPCKVEQEKIAGFLTALDNKVNLINKQLKQAKLFKKFLLQRMLV